MAPIVACGIRCTTLFLLSYVVYQACESVSDPHTWQALPTMYASACTSCKKSTNLQESNSGKQHYLRAMFTRAGSYCLAVAVVDPVSSETVQIPPHSALSRLVILPGAAVAAQTHISNLPEHLTAGKL